jgi:hypothetical protein
MHISIDGAIRIIRTSIMVKYGSPIGSWGELSDKKPRIVVIAYITSKKKTTQAEVIPIIRY